MPTTFPYNHTGTSKKIKSQDLSPPPRIYIYICPKTQKLANGTRYRAEIYTKHSMDDFQFNCRIFNSPFPLVQKIWTFEAWKRPQKRPKKRPFRAQYTSP